MISCFAVGLRRLSRSIVVLAAAALATASTLAVAPTGSVPAGIVPGSILIGAALAAEPPKFAGLAGDFSPINPPLQIPALAFEDKLGQPVTLESFRGKVVLLNFWATWCPPCVFEMPALDRLQSQLGGDGFAVVAVSTDREGIKASAPFYRRAGLTHLTLYNDTRGGLLGAMQSRALPTSILIDREGRVIGRLEGPAVWDSAAAKALIEHYLKGGAS